MQRMRRAAALRRDRRNRHQSRRVLALVIQNHPHRTGASSGQNLFVVLFVIAPPSQELEPTTILGRFIFPQIAAPK